MPGAPPFYRDEIAKYKGWQAFQKYHHTTLPLWTKAKYGGHHITYFYFLVPQTFRLYDTQVLNRTDVAGMMLYVDSGRCSLLGREGQYDTCNGKYSHNDGYELVPGIFEKWEQPTLTSYIFHMRKGVLWPSTPPMARTDREVTADDMVWWLQTTKDGGIMAPNYVLVDAFEALDRYTVKITMKLPDADFLLSLAHTSQGIFSRECFEEKDCLGAVKSVSPGPFLVKQHELSQKLVLEKNPEFYLKGLPYYDLITVLNMSDPIAINSAFITAQIDDGFPITTEEAVATVGRVKGAYLQLGMGHGAVSGVMRPAFKGPLADVRVRRALTMTMDPLQMWEASDGGVHMFSPLVSRHYFGEGFFYTKEQMGEWYQFNPERAKQLLVEAGFPNGFSLKLNTLGLSWYGSGIALHLQQNWKKYLGIDLKVLTNDFVAWSTAYSESSWDGLLDQMCCWIPSCWGTADDAFAQFVTGSVQNVQKINDPIIEDLNRRQRSELDPAKRNLLLYEFEKYELDNVLQLRTGGCPIYITFQPWEMNGASHGTMYFQALNGPTWLGMHDTSHPGYPNR
ncbi:MAG: ABC transporter substrate-binding protein [Dehalococcoidia bacterium]|nr:ABC transporter substrate-binding protein [Dehalococcoidia bacterium]